MRVSSDIMGEPYFNYTIAGVSVTPEILKRTTQVQVIHSDEMSDSAKITIEDPEYNIFDSPAIVEGSTIVIEGGYTKKHEQLLKGYIAGLTPNFPTSGAPSITLVCMDESYPMSITPKKRSWKKVKRSTVVSIILQEYGIQGDIQDTEVVVSSLTQSDQTDIAYIMRLASEVGFQCWIRDGVCHFRARDLQGSAKGKFYYNSGDSSLLSFVPQFILPKDISSQNKATVVTQNVSTNKTTSKTTISNPPAVKPGPSTGNYAAPRATRAPSPSFNPVPNVFIKGRG